MDFRSFLGKSSVGANSFRFFLFFPKAPDHEVDFLHRGDIRCLFGSECSFLETDVFSARRTGNQLVVFFNKPEKAVSIAVVIEIADGVTSCGSPRLEAREIRDLAVIDRQIIPNGMKHFGRIGKLFRPIQADRINDSIQMALVLRRIRDAFCFLFLPV